uniref:Uncharacterized protein n=1 Tax=Glossina pallidipes TaxID=7398 RepID=A0A1A9Z9T7_GLOPL
MYDIIMFVTRKNPDDEQQIFKTLQHFIIRHLMHTNTNECNCLYTLLGWDVGAIRKRVDILSGGVSIINTAGEWEFTNLVIVTATIINMHQTFHYIYKRFDLILFDTFVSTVTMSFFAASNGTSRISMGLKRFLKLKN